MLCANYHSNEISEFISVLHDFALLLRVLTNTGFKQNHFQGRFVFFSFTGFSVSVWNRQPHWDHKSSSSEKKWLTLLTCPYCVFNVIQDMSRVKEPVNGSRTEPMTVSLKQTQWAKWSRHRGREFENLHLHDHQHRVSSISVLPVVLAGLYIIVYMYTHKIKKHSLTVSESVSKRERERERFVRRKSNNMLHNSKCVMLNMTEKHGFA